MRHRAVVLVVLMVLSLLLFLVMVAGGIATWNGQSLTALLVAILLAAAGGVAFSWRRYFGRRQP
jgi:hypothetical protein